MRWRRRLDAAFSRNLMVAVGLLRRCGGTQLCFDLNCHVPASQQQQPSLHFQRMSCHCLLAMRSRWGWLSWPFAEGFWPGKDWRLSCVLPLIPQTRWRLIWSLLSLLAPTPHTGSSHFPTCPVGMSVMLPYLPSRDRFGIFQRRWWLLFLSNSSESYNEPSDVDGKRNTWSDMLLSVYWIFFNPTRQQYSRRSSMNVCSCPISIAFSISSCYRWWLNPHWPSRVRSLLQLLLHQERAFHV